MSPTTALLWEMWRRHRWMIGGIVALTVVGRVVDAIDTNGQASWAEADTSSLAVFLGIVAFALLSGAISPTESTDGRALGQLPRRLFVLPLTTLRIVTVSMAVGVTATELLLIFWWTPFFRGGTVSSAFPALLFGAFAVFHLSVLWTLERAGPLRLFVTGLIVFGLFVVGTLPTFAPSPPPWWRSEPALAAMVLVLALVAYAWTWIRVAQLRAGGGQAVDGRRLGVVVGALSARSRAQQRPFASPAAAQFWYEWRQAGVVLPALVVGVAVCVAVASWLTRHNSANTMSLTLTMLAAPIVLAVPIGVAFSKPSVWSEDQALPAFVAVRPMSDVELVATKVRVAAASALCAWAVVMAFLVVWLNTWANLDALGQFALQLWAFHGQSVAAVYAIGALVVAAGLFLTWRSLVSRLWSGLSGIRWGVVGGVLSILTVVIASLVFPIGRLPAWLLEEPARLVPILWTLAALVVIKMWLAVYAWRGIDARYLRAYLLAWLVGTVTCLVLAIVVWRIARIYLPLDVERARSLVVLWTLLAMPLVRIGLAPRWLARNRHR